MGEWLAFLLGTSKFEHLWVFVCVSFSVSKRSPSHLSKDCKKPVSHYFVALQWEGLRFLYPICKCLLHLLVFSFAPDHISSTPQAYCPLDLIVSVQCLLRLDLLFPVRRGISWFCQGEGGFLEPTWCLRLPLPSVWYLTFPEFLSCSWEWMSFFFSGLFFCMLSGLTLFSSKPLILPTPTFRLYVEFLFLFLLVLKRVLRGGHLSTENPNGYFHPDV